MVYDGGGSDANTYADFDGSGNLLTRYLYAPAVDATLARTSSGGTSAWYLPDKLGSIRDIADTSGAVIDHVVYSSFGTVTSETNSANGDRFKFTAREYDSPTGLYYFRARYYDGAAARFTSQDPIAFAAGDSDLYRYVRNSPATKIDPSGLADRSWFPGTLITGSDFRMPNDPNLTQPTMLRERDELEVQIPQPGSSARADALVLPGVGLIQIHDGTVILVSYDPATKTYTLLVRRGWFLTPRIYPVGQGNPFRKRIPAPRTDQKSPTQEDTLPLGPGRPLIGGRDTHTTMGAPRAAKLAPMRRRTTPPRQTGPAAMDGP
jgi:RHS repeat-associated protein